MDKFKIAEFKQIQPFFNLLNSVISNEIKRSRKHFDVCFVYQKQKCSELM